MEGLRYVYFGDTRGFAYHGGVVAVGYFYNPETKKMQYAVAFCSPNDRFYRRKAHAIIKSRMINGLYNESDLTYDIPPKYVDTIADIIAQFGAAVEKFNLEEYEGEKIGGDINLANTIRGWIADGKEFGDEEIFSYISNHFYNSFRYASDRVFPDFCGVSVPFWALKGLVENRSN
jgi:hypothetical protein